MKRAVIAVLVSGLVAVPAAIGAKPVNSSVTISASPSTLTIGSTTTISGLVTGSKAAGATVTLKETPWPYTTAPKVVGSTKANSTGHYSFSVKPAENTHFVVQAKAGPTATSKVAAVRVKVKVTFGVGTLHPVAGHKDLFKGTVQPGFNGRTVAIQRRTASGKWHTVSHATLVATTNANGFTRSKFSKKLKISKTGTYRIRFVPPNGAWLANNSGSHKLTVS